MLKISLSLKVHIRDIFLLIRATELFLTKNQFINVFFLLFDMIYFSKTLFLAVKTTDASLKLTKTR